MCQSASVDYIPPSPKVTRIPMSFSAESQVLPEHWKIVEQNQLPRGISYPPKSLYSHGVIAILAQGNKQQWPSSGEKGLRYLVRGLQLLTEGNKYQLPLNWMQNADCGSETGKDNLYEFLLSTCVKPSKVRSRYRYMCMYALDSSRGYYRSSSPDHAAALGTPVRDYFAGRLKSALSATISFYAVSSET